MSTVHMIVRLGMELGLAVSDYNSHVTDTFDEIIKITLAYLHGVKDAVKAGHITPTEIPSYFALVGQSWGSIQSRLDNEYILETVKKID
jgi:hypothetical protein